MHAYPAEMKLTQEAQVCARIKLARRSRGWSLAEFETRSNGKIKAVVLGSYERGSRALSVKKLILISEVLDTPLSFLLDGQSKQVELKSKLMIDIRAVKNDSQSGAFGRFAVSILELRGDWNGEVLTLRNSDLQTIELLFNSDSDGVIQYLRKKKYLLEPLEKSD